MDFSAIKKIPEFKEETFRTPLNIERNIGLWVDRIGSGVELALEHQLKLRLLGQYAAVYIEEGNGFLVSKNYGKTIINSNDTILVFPDEPCSYYPENKWISRWVVWNGPNAKKLEYTGYISKSNMVLRDSNSTVLKAHNLLSEIINNEHMEAILKRKLIVLEMIYNLFKSTTKTDQQPDQLSIMNKAIEYISENITENLSVQELAQKFNLSESHFRRLFKKYTGRSPKEFAISMNISLAKKLLSEGKTIKETSFLCGYDDIYYFMRNFKKNTGITVGQFKNLKR